jgi:hypothetical protein
MSGLYNLKSGVADSADSSTVVEAALANGAVTIPDRGRKIVVMTKAGVAAMTLGTPTTAQNGVEIVFTAATANAHTVTAATIGFNAGNAGTDIATFGAAIGDGFTVVAYEGEWLVTSNINVTFA